MSETRRVYSTLEPAGGPPASRFAGRMHALAGAALAPVGLLGGFLGGSPGIRFRLTLVRLATRGLLRGTLSVRTAHELFVRPLDSVRHFEFEFCHDRIRQRTFSTYLDVSSPRLLPLALLAATPGVRAVLCNPDPADLERSRALARELGVDASIEFSPLRADQLAFPQRRFDLVTCVSVFEHIPGEGDVEALRKLWQLVQARGRLVVTVPCAAETFDEYLDLNEYGQAVPQQGRFHFGQRFYSRAMLQQRFFAAAREPAAIEIYGERAPGVFFADRARRVRDRYYPHWRELIMMGREYRRYHSIDDLPGVGVAAMVFRKP